MVKCPNEDERGHKTKCPRSSFFFFFLVFHFMKMEDMLCIENIGENTLASLFLTNSRDNIVGFVSSRKVVEGMYF